LTWDDHKKGGMTKLKISDGIVWGFTLYSSEMVKIVADCDVWRLHLELLLLQPSRTRKVPKEEH